jgi:7,8-dihydropterin-6-yl-methyl-4-(beta-D-ribofuranosyl)aminobenzene 5'-phosphate synthase
MKVTVLVESETGHHPDLATQNGLSLFIEANGSKMIFDFGYDETYRMNAQSLGVDLTDTDFAVLSHAHSDHGGGISDFVHNFSVAPIYMSSLCRGEYFYKSIAFMKKSIGVNKLIDSIESEQSDRIRTISENTVIEEGQGFHILFNTHRDGFVPKSNSNLYRMVDGELVSDMFKHETILVVEEYDGISIVTGCSHSGITNMVRTVKDEFEGKDIKLLIGGFHLINPSKGSLAESEDTIREIASELISLGVKRVVTGYCTGSDALEVLSTFGDLNVDLMKIGDVIYSE